MPTGPRPFLKWAGNKYRCMSRLLSVFPKGSRLIEPFTGSAAVFLNAKYPKYLLAEQNQDLINLYQSIQTEGLSFIHYCNDFFSGCFNNAESYYQLRNAFNQCQDKRQRAALFLYLNRHGYNGLCRYNQSGIYNVPFGRYAKPYFPLKEMLFFYEKSAEALFLQNDFRQTFTLAKPGDVIYCDPPYVPLSATAHFSAYVEKVFGEAEQIALAQLAMDYASQGVTVIISNHDLPFTRHHYQKATEIIYFPVRRSISCNSLQRADARELVAVFRPLKPKGRTRAGTRARLRE